MEHHHLMTGELVYHQDNAVVCFFEILFYALGLEGNPLNLSGKPQPDIDLSRCRSVASQFFSPLDEILVAVIVYGIGDGVIAVKGVSVALFDDRDLRFQFCVDDLCIV